jgi:tRNA A-37 threonylcarbamoyl transferase component Bud32
VTPIQALADQARRKPLFFWIAGLLGFVMLALYLFAGVMISRYGSVTRDPGWKPERRDGRWYVADVDPQGAAAGNLQAGDVILAINDDPRIASIDSSELWWVTARQDAYSLEVKRGSEQRHFELQLERTQSYRNLGVFLSNIAASLGFYLVGLMLGLLKPEDRLTRRASLTLLAWASYTLYIALEPVAQVSTFWERVVHFSINLLYPLQFALSYYFYYRFPASAPRGRLWTSLGYVLYVWAGLIYVRRVWVGVGVLATESAIGFLSGHPRLLSFRAAPAALELTAVLAMCAVILRNYLLVREPDQRRRIKWMIFGSIVGILPSVLYMVFRLIFPGTGQPASAEGAVRYLSFVIGNFMSVAVPISVGYAVLKHRLFDVQIVIRRGLQYLFAKQVLRIVLALPLAALVLTIIVNRDLSLTVILTGNPILLVLIAAVGLSLKYRRQLTHWIDRRFFREAYSQEQILLNLIEKIKELDSMPELSRLVSKEVEAAMHPERLYVFYRGEEKHDLTLGYSSGGQSNDLRITEESALLRLMQRQRVAQDFPMPPLTGLPEDETAWLSQLGVNLIVPMSGADSRLAGLLLLGEKKSEEPYTPNDRQLLQTITAQMAVVYENVWLKEQSSREHKIKHEVLARFEDQQINLVKECPACGACYDSTSETCDKDRRELTLSLPVERTIDSKYRLEKLIGRGGMGAVYEATDLRLNRRIAIKIMLGNMFGDRVALRRFEREAQASARLNHPNIISVYDYGGIRTDGAYLVMELVRGFTLRSELQRAGRLDPQTAAVWFTQLLEGVNAAHQAGVIHRDLKPENVLISTDAPTHEKTRDQVRENIREQIKVLDFGLAKILQVDPANPQSLTAPGMIMGTFAYMSPEQVTGEVDERSDIFSLGVMVVEALTGQRPFAGRTSAELITAILSAPFHLPGESPALQQLDEVLQRCLAKDPGQRFASVAAMQQELIPAIEHCPAPAPAGTAGDATMSSEEATTGLLPA